MYAKKIQVTSGMFHKLSSYAKHCITTLSHAYIFGKFMEIFGKVPGFLEDFGYDSKQFLKSSYYF